MASTQTEAPPGMGQQLAETAEDKQTDEAAETFQRLVQSPLTTERFVEQLKTTYLPGGEIVSHSSLVDRLSPEDGALILAYAEAIGENGIQCLLARDLYVITDEKRGKKTLGMSASKQRERLFRFHGDDALKVVEWTVQRCAIRGKRRTSTEYTEIEYTWDEAVKANLANKRNWQNHPKDMMMARATTRLLRLIAPEVLGGCYDPEVEFSEPAPANGAGRKARAPAPPKRVIDETPPVLVAGQTYEGVVVAFQPEPEWWLTDNAKVVKGKLAEEYRALKATAAANADALIETTDDAAGLTALAALLDRKNCTPPTGLVTDLIATIEAKTKSKSWWKGVKVRIGQHEYVFLTLSNPTTHKWGPNVPVTLKVDELAAEMLKPGHPKPGTGIPTCFMSKADVCSNVRAVKEKKAEAPAEPEAKAPEGNALQGAAAGYYDVLGHNGFLALCNKHFGTDKDDKVIEPHRVKDSSRLMSFCNEAKEIQEKGGNGLEEPPDEPKHPEGGEDEHAPATDIPDDDCPF